ncbi:MAG: hypothetical protein NTY01_03470 [Verrucomicrobia bacterium]|nr:hypothetical protein [Verrucomicrobiota bacterium]
MKQNELTRRQWLKTSIAAATAICGGTLRSRAAEAGTPVNIASRRELFVDDSLIERMTGAELKLHKPEAKDVALVCDAPWEGNTSAYYAIFRDKDRFRAYYRGSHVDETRKATHPEVACHAESKDGIAWTKPKLGVCEFNGSKDNNIVWTGDGSHNFTPFKDANPACARDARYKALAGGFTLVNGKKKSCLNALKSADGVRWTIMSEGVITAGAFDSQNLAFWDSVRREYRAYWRIFTAGYTDERGWKPEGVRAIRTATSKNFIHWENQADLKYMDSPPEHLYTNAVMPYFRAPHLFVAFPTRFQPKTQQVEPVFMTSRDGVLFRRWPAELIPITAPKDRDGNRSNYMTWGLLQLPGNDRELSVYATEAYYAGPASRVRRFTFRTDGFVSVHASAKGELFTKPLRFTGRALELNCRAAAQGSIRVEIQDADGKPLPKFSLADCQPISGDDIARIVKWKSGTSVSALAGKPVRLRFVMENADLFAMRFQ